MRHLLLSILIGALILVSSPCWAEIPHLINYEGMLAQNDGTPLNGSYDLCFKIYGSESGDDSLWCEYHSSVAMTNGLFSVILGGMNPISPSVFNDTLRYLGVTVGTDPELSPRMRLTSVGYAFKSEIADTALYAVETASAESDSDWTFSGNNIYSGVSGNVGIGTSNPQGKLDINGTLAVKGNIGSYGMVLKSRGAGIPPGWEYLTIPMPEYSPGDFLEASANALVEVTSLEPIKCKEILVGRSGGVRIEWEMRQLDTGVNFWAKVYKNGVPYSKIDHIVVEDYFVAFSEDIQVEAGDLVQLYCWTEWYPPGGGQVRNFGIYVENPTLPVVIMD